MTAAALQSDSAHVPGAITALFAEYAHVIDGDLLEEWPGLFTEPCLYKITTRENVRRKLPAAIMLCESRGMLKDRVVSVRRANVFEPHGYRHMVSCIRVLGSEGNEFRLQSNFMIARIMRTGALTLFCTGEYLDRVVLHDGRAQFRERLAVCDHGVIDNLIAIPL